MYSPFMDRAFSSRFCFGAPADAPLVFGQGAGEAIEPVVIRTAEAEKAERMEDQPGVDVF
jgi:hypothetical protein